MTSTSSVYAIETQALCKIFGDNNAVKSLTLQVMQGEVFGFLGPNGAGKTTSIKILLGLITPTSGKANVLGVSIDDTSHARVVRKRVGFLPEHFRFHDWLSAQEFLTLHGRLYGMENQPLNKRVTELLDLVGLLPFSKKLLSTYSKGMLQRIGLAQALLNSPELIILDEPTSGLDPVGRRMVRDIIYDLKKQGTCVFINSHLLSEIEITCDRVAFIKHGEVLRVAEMNSLKEVRTSVRMRLSGMTPQILSNLSQWGNNIQQKEDEITIDLDQEEFIPVMTRYLVNHGVDLYAVSPQRMSLEELFVQTIGTDGSL
jgi:ABC-2 type transport system ATP-binding protein